MQALLLLRVSYIEEDVKQRRKGEGGENRTDKTNLKPEQSRAITQTREQNTI